jgi:hypothetical protein
MARLVLAGLFHAQGSVGSQGRQNGRLFRTFHFTLFPKELLT